MIDSEYILERKREIESFIGMNMDEIPPAIIDKLNEFHNELTSLVFVIDNENLQLRRYNEHLFHSRRQIYEMFQEENIENAKRNDKQFNWYTKRILNEGR